MDYSINLINQQRLWNLQQWHKITIAKPQYFYLNYYRNIEFWLYNVNNYLKDKFPMSSLPSFADSLPKLKQTKNYHNVAVPWKSTSQLKVRTGESMSQSHLHKQGFSTLQGYNERTINCYKLTANTVIKLPNFYSSNWNVLDCNWRPVKQFQDCRKSGSQVFSAVMKW